MSGLTAAGYEAPTFNEILVLIRADYQAELRRIEGLPGLVIDFDADTFLGIMTGVVARRLASLSEASQGVYDAWNVNNATGIQLDDLASMAGVPRKGARPSTAVVLITGTVGTVLARGLEVEGGGVDGKARWGLVDTTTIGAGGIGAALVEAVVPGPVVAIADQITKIVSPVEGWDSVSNTGNAIVGRDRETDSELRLRRAESLQIGGGRSLAAIRANVLALPFVNSAAVVENATSVDRTVQGLSLPPHSFAAVVAPSTLSVSETKRIMEVLYALSPTGIQSVGDIASTVTGADGFAKAVAFYYAGELPVTVTISLEPRPGFSVAGIAEEVKPLIVAYFAALRVGECVERLEIFGLLAQVAGIKKASVALNTLDLDIEPLITQVARLSGEPVVKVMS